MEEDVRWIQRLANYRRAVVNLGEAAASGGGSGLNRLEKQGLVKGFELAYELAWLTIKDFYERQGVSGIQGSRDAFQLAFQRGLVEDGEVFIRMIRSRQLAVHTYNESTADEIIALVFSDYYPALYALLEGLDDERAKRT